MIDFKSIKIAVIGLGYVGLPVAVAFGKQRPTIGFDLDTSRIDELLRSEDRTLEVTPQELQAATYLAFTSDPSAITDANFYIITVPTPIDEGNKPDLGALRAASRAVGKVLSHGDIVVYESTVYPGATEEVCVPILAEVSGLTFNDEFYVGYSPERINPGDKIHCLANIIKVTSGSTEDAADLIDQVYKSIITAGTHRASSIKVAEAAKVIENTQRDINIALVNEFSMIFRKLGIDTSAVLAAAGTKWNFLAFQPGLVGGHCIGVDPYYLAYKAEMVGYHPEMILAGRRINSRMAANSAEQVIKAMIARDMRICQSRALVMGLTFKENCPDIRNSKVVDLIAGLESFGMIVDVHDPWVPAHRAKAEYDIDLVEFPRTGGYSAVILAVPHDIFLKAPGAPVSGYMSNSAVLMDLKSALPKPNDYLCL